MGQGAHFIGHHSKTSTTLPRPRRFNGRVQRQQIGLLGNGANHIQHLADILRLIGQGPHQFPGTLHVMGQRTDRAGRLADSFLPQMRRLTGLASGIGGGHGVTSDLFHSGGHFIDRRGRLLNFVVLLLQALIAVEGNGVQFIGSRGQLRRGAADALQGFPQILLHGRQCLEQTADFVVAMGFDRASQVALRHMFRCAHGFTQRTHDAAGQ
ncbi:hypothetical protein D3C85_1008530 [compost metagenome]